MAGRYFRLLVFDGNRDVCAALDLVVGNIAVAVWRARIELNNQKRGKTYELWQFDRPPVGGHSAPAWRLSASEDKLAVRSNSRAP